jgi:hypothetical protein
LEAARQAQHFGGALDPALPLFGGLVRDACGHEISQMAREQGRVGRQLLVGDGDLRRDPNDGLQKLVAEAELDAANGNQHGDAEHHRHHRDEAEQPPRPELAQREKDDDPQPVQWSLPFGVPASGSGA